MSDTIIKLAIMLYDFCLLAGTAYLVTVYNWSMWTFVLTFCFFLTTKDKK